MATDLPIPRLEPVTNALLFIVLFLFLISS
jgi:hypothetical protein